MLLLAESFPASEVAGYDISQHALERARARLAASGLVNASFHDARHSPLPDDGSLDLVTTFDCIHDMTDPGGMMAAIRAALRDDGTWLLVDIKALDTFAENVARNPMAPLMYGISVLSCLSSALSEPGGAGLGTLGLSAGRAEAMARDAGFTRFRRLPVDHAINSGDRPSTLDGGFDGNERRRCESDSAAVIAGRRPPERPPRLRRRTVRDCAQPPYLGHTLAPARACLPGRPFGVIFGTLIGGRERLVPPSCCRPGQTRRRRGVPSHPTSPRRPALSPPCAHSEQGRDGGMRIPAGATRGSISWGGSSFAWP